MKGLRHVSYEPSVYEKVKKEFEQKKMEQIRLRNERIDIVYKKAPKLLEIDKEISRVGSEMVQLILSKPERADDFVKMVKETLIQMKQERINVLVANGFPKDYTDIKYRCKKCEDTGFVDGAECECYKERLREEAYRESNLSALIKTQTFEKFNVFLFSDKPGNKNISPRELAKENLEFCKNYARDFDSHNRSLLLYGGAGLGKTFLSTCIAKKLIDDGKNVMYQSAVTMFGYYMDYIFNRIEAQEARNEFAKLKKCDLLIIDDLGAESTNAQMSAFLFELLNDRILSDKKTLISTNYNLQEIAKTYSERIHSRIMQHFDIVRFEGTDIRGREIQ